MSLVPPTLSISRVTPREERKPTLQYPAEHSLAPSTGGGQAECAVVAAAWSAPSSPQLIRASPTSPMSSSDVPVAAEGRDAADGRGTRPLQLDGLPQGRRPQPLSTSCSRMCTGGMGGRSWRTAGTPSCRRRSLRCRRSSLVSIRPAQSGGRAVACAVGFRPFIDIDKGKVKHIVGSTLRDASNDGTTRVTNFESDKSPSELANIYKEDGLVGGQVIMLGGDPASCYAALEALLFVPHHLRYAVLKSTQLSHE
ncbi:uncharacterized protein LOC119310601 [Triticum dicoccoides]|uniref:uncharacterized protein LOC119310601 n=1 Tax=Triticum dicoccoides TaxID=85692 RepID=UPI0018919127|nr:uncharacterized protein LOC119310601 [Triticum dicoccoides]